MRSAQDEEKKERERGQFEVFRELHPELVGGSIDQPMEPEPDIVCTLGDRRFGIEITEIHFAPDARFHEAEQEKVVQRAQLEYEKDGSPCVQVSVSWSPYVKPRGSDRIDLASDLAQIVKKHRPPAGQCTRLGFGRGYERELLHDFFHSIRIERIVAYLPGQTAWSSSCGWWMPTGTPDLFQREIDDKRGQPSRYAAYDEIWLLLVKHGSAPSSGFENDAAVLEALYASPFTRIFLLELTPRRVVELRRTGAP